MGGFVRDVRTAWRAIRKTPGVAVVIVITIALGVGVNTVIFGVVNAFLLRPLPVSKPEQITVLAIQQKNAPVGSSGFSYPEFSDFRNQGKQFVDVFGVVLGSAQFRADERADECYVNYVSSNFFSTLGMAASHGLLSFPGQSETSGEQAVAVLDYAYWTRRFGADPAVVGKQVRVNGKPTLIIGVAPREFHGLFSVFETDVYLSMSAISSEEAGNVFWRSRERRRILAFARLRDGTTVQAAQSGLDVIAGRLADSYPATNGWFTVRVVPEKSARPIPYANESFVAISGLFIMLAALVLLLACMNVENILLARGTSRHREMGIRAALGAGRWQLMRQMLAETMILAILGGAAGSLLAVDASRWINSVHLQNIPLQLSSTVDWRVFVFAGGSVLLAGIVVGLLPAMRASSADVNSVLHEGGGNAYRMSQPAIRNLLVIAQVAGSFVLLTVAGLFARSLLKVEGFALGFDPDHVLNVVMDPQEGGFNETRTAAFYSEIEGKVRTLPGVESASLASYVPMGGFPSKAAISVEGRGAPEGDQAPNVLFNCVDSPYFDTMRITLLRGREFRESDTESAPRVAIINRTMAEKFWPGQEAVGKRFSMSRDNGPWMEIVGVATDGKYQTIAENSQPFFYVPLAQNFVSKRVLQIRTTGPPESLMAPVKQAILASALEVSIIDIETMRQLLGGALGFFAFRLAATLAGVLGAVGVILAVVGVYGVVSFAVGQRIKEIGIRVALGASGREVLAMVWMQGARLAFAGVAIGIVLAWAATREIGHLIAGISTGDAVTYIGAVALLAGVTLAACWIPARRALRVDPMVVLRSE
jgi:predicted permease